MVLSDEFEDLSRDLRLFDRQKCCFYYDESNNIRKLWLKETDFNAPIDSDFVLGGVMHFGEAYVADVDKLKSEMQIQRSAGEMKFRHISKSRDFLGCLSERKVQLFLQWLYGSDLYVHCSNTNNLYFAIVDVVDSIDELIPQPFLIAQMKNELYKIVRANYHGFYNFLVEYQYPNVATAHIPSFYQKIVNFVDDSNVQLSFELELLRQGLKSARQQKELVFLQDNPDRTIIDSYFMFFLRPIGLFPTAYHLFDNEYVIEDEFNKIELLFNGAKASNYRFDNSKNHPLIQVSDCIVGLLGKYFTFVNSINFGDINHILEKISPTQRHALKTFAQVMHKSENKSKLLHNSFQSLEEHDIGAAILYRALKYAG